VACSGATIQDLYEFNAGNGTAWQKPQIRAVAPDHTRLVTLSIGGNNVDFAGIVKSCVSGIQSGGSDGCWRRNDKKATAAIRRLSEGADSTPSLESVYVDIAKRIMPGGELIVAGYPQLFGYNVIRELNGSGTCQLGTAGGTFIYNVSSLDMEWMNKEGEQLNDAISHAVDAAQAKIPQVTIVFAPVSDRFAGHRLCDYGKSWINGVEFAGISPKQTSLHPNEAGQWAYAAAIQAARDGQPTLGIQFGPHVLGYGEVRPSEIDNGGDSNGIIENITWSEWGGTQAFGDGTADWIPPGKPMAEGIRESAKVVAFDLGNCKGATVYRSVTWFFPQHGESFHPSRRIDACNGF
jgi:hypothetical protein